MVLFYNLLKFTRGIFSVDVIFHIYMFIQTLSIDRAGVAFY